MGPTEAFEFVIGNPPYVPITSLSEDEKGFFRSRYETARRRFDLYLLFFERALKSLKPAGRLIFITPEKFLYVESACALRRMLSRVQIEELRLIDEKIFGDLVAYPTITSVLNRAPCRPTTIIRRNGNVARVSLDGSGESWMPLICGGRRAHAALQLRDICIRISCGVATGADHVFVRPSLEVERELQPFAYPTIAGRQLTEVERIASATYSMLIPYARDGSLLPEDALGALRRYLLRPGLRERLMARTCVKRKPWYAFHETPVLDGILQPKILCKDITQAPVFWIDRKGTLVPRHSVYYIVPRDPLAVDELCHYLNSAEAREWLNSHCQRAANNFLRIQSNVIKELPVPPGLASAAATPTLFSHARAANTGVFRAGTPEVGR